ncbi:unnamed protein product, partial [marine sediment metagenome]
MLILFTSICKTGSGSFWWGIKHNFDAKRFWVKNNIRAYRDLMSLGNLGIYEALQTGTKIKITTEEPQFIVTHFPHGLHKVLPIEKFEYITFLRHPMRRSISEIQYVLGGESIYRNRMNLCVFFDNQKWDYKKLNSKQLKAVLEYCLEHSIGCNIMTKQLSGLEPLSNIFPKHKRPSGSVYTPGSSNLVKYHSSTMETFLEAAKKNLKDYKFIGFQENGSNDHKLCSKVF